MPVEVRPYGFCSEPSQELYGGWPEFILRHWEAYDPGISKTISVSVPHDLTQDEARARIQNQIIALRASHGSKVAQVHERWTDNHLDFDLRAMGQQVTVRLDILPHEVKLAVDLLWMLVILAGKFTRQVEQEGRRLL
jgi:hypothetical protein